MGCNTPRNNLESMIESTGVEGGIGKPQQRVRYQQVEHLRYYDAQRKANVDIVVPHDADAEADAVRT